MQVMDFHGSVVQMECQVGVMVVMDILTVHHQVLQLISALCYAYCYEYRHQLPEKDRQKKQGAKSAEHGGDFEAGLALTVM